MQKSIRYIAGIVAIGCLLPALLQAADSLEDAFREISKQLITQLPKGQTLAVAPIQHNKDQCSELSFYALDRFSAQLFAVGRTKVKIVLRQRLEEVLKEHEISNFNIFSPEDRKKLGKFSNISAMIIGSFNVIGQMIEFDVSITDIETADVLAMGFTKFPATIDLRTLMKRKKECTYFRDLYKKNGPGPHNDLPTPAPYKGGSDDNWKFDRSVNVLEWIYTQNGSVLPTSVNYSLDVKKITLAANKILVTANFHSNKIHYDYCQVACTLSDDIGSDYGTLYTKMGKIYTRRINQTVTINCPAPKEFAEIITIRMANNKSHYNRCGSLEFVSLPAFNMKLLPVGGFTE